VCFSPGGEWYFTPPGTQRSTLLILPIFPVTTIEHNEAWCASLREQLKANNVTNVNLICSPVAWHSFGMSCMLPLWFLHAWLSCPHVRDSGETPEGDGTYEQFQDYVDMVDTLGIPHIDVVFIDGRFAPDPLSWFPLLFPLSNGSQGSCCLCYEGP
jgi:hypothetical protein